MKWHKLRDYNGREQMGKRALYRESSTLRIVYYSYSTPILAWAYGAGWLRNPRRYSVTTTRHMSYALKDAGYPIVSYAESDEAFRLTVFGDANLGGGRIG